MKRLERVIFVNWYLFDSQQFDLRGDVLITGSNGSGKTSLLDAIQVVALGGHGHDIQLNANAGEKGERSIKGYCLGQLSSEDGKGGFSVVREDAITHIGLVFTDEKTGESTTIGICMSAKKSMPKHEVHGLYVAEGMKLSLDDYLASSTQGDIPLSWEQFKHDLMRKSAQKGISPFVFGNAAEKYQKQLCLSLGPKGRQLDWKKFIHSFKKAVNLKDIDNVSDFVKLFVLDENPININKLDQSVTIYKEMLEAAKGVTEQLDLMGDIDKHFKKWDELLKDLVAYEWVEKEYQFIRADLKRSELEDGQRELIEAYWDVLKSLEECNESLACKKTLMVDLKQQLDSDDRQSQSRALTAEIEGLEVKISHAKTALQENITNIQRIAGLGRYSQYFTDNAKAMVDRAKEMLPNGEMEALSWPKKPVKADADVTALLSDIKVVLTEYSEKKDSLAIEHSEAAKAFASECKRLRQLESGGSDVSQNTLALQLALEKEGIEATPLCDLAEITDLSWQPVIESYLGSNVEALFVASDDAERAVQIFKDLNRKKSLYGASVINTRKVENWKTKVNPRSCAAFIKSDNSIVEAFLSRMLNRLICVQTAADLVKEDIAITSEGMLSKSGSIKTLRMPRNVILGKKARERNLEQLQERLALDGANVEELRKSKVDVNELYNLINTAFGKLEGWKPTVDLQKNCKASEEGRDLKTKQLNAIDLNHLDKIREDHELAKRAVSKLGNEHTDLIGKRASMRTQHDAMHDKAVGIIEKVDICAEEHAEIESLPLFDMELASKKEEQLQKETDGDYDIMKLAESKKEECLTKSSRHEQRGRNALRDYCIRFKIERRKDDTSTCELWAWLVDNIKRLNDTELAKYEGDARRALFDAEATFKTDIAFKLSENISSMKRLVAELNRSLKSRPFSGGEIYQFHYSVNSEYEDIIRFVEKTTLETQANAGSLLDKDRDFANVLIERIKTDKEAVSDYRNYFSYDIKIRSEGSKTTSKLSKRMGVASGGENRTPYYVTIGASMASAYRISSDIHANDGIGLIPLDEAFHKMDGNNYFQAGQYIKDIGLQMILAAPDDAQIKLLPLVETVIFLSRHGENISSNVTYLKNGVAELLASDNPDLNPALLEAANNG